MSLNLAFADVYLDLLVFGGVVDGALAVLVEGEASAVLEQPADGLEVASGGGEVQGGGAVAVSQVGVDALFLDLAVKKLHCNKNRRFNRCL